MGMLPYIQIALSVLLVVTILLQKTGAGLGGAFGGDNFSTFHTRRGTEKALFKISLILAVLFVISSAILALQ